MASETWLVLKEVDYHWENDGPRVLRKGLEASDETYSLEKMINFRGKAWVAAQLRRIADEVERGAR